MQNYLNTLIAAMLSVFALSLTSCGDADELKDGKLVDKLQGTWTFYHAKVTTMGQTFEFDADDLDEIAGSMGASGFYDDVMTFDGMKVNGVEYQVDGNRLNIPSWYEDWWFYISFKGDEMYMDFEITQSGITIEEKLTYKRVSSKSGYAPANEDSTGLFRALQSGK